MSPQLLARLSEFRRSMAVCGTTSDGHLSSTMIYGSWQPRGGWLALFVACEAIERLEEEDDDEFERRPFDQVEFDEFRVRPEIQQLVDDILAELDDEPSEFSDLPAADGGFLRRAEGRSGSAGLLPVSQPQGGSRASTYA